MLARLADLEERASGFTAVAAASDAPAGRSMQGQLALSSALLVTQDDNAGSSSRNSSSGALYCGRFVDAADAAAGLLERLLLTLQCAALDADAVRNECAAVQLEVLAGGLVAGVEAAAARWQLDSVAAVGVGSAGTAAALVALRNATGAVARQRNAELEAANAELASQLLDARNALTNSAATHARLMRALELRERRVRALEAQVAEICSDRAAFTMQQTARDSDMLAAHADAAVAQQQAAAAAAAAASATADAAAARRTAAAAHAELDIVRGRAEDAATAGSSAAAALADAEAASRRDAAAAVSASAAAASATLAYDAMRVKLEASSSRVRELEEQLRAAQQRAHVCVSTARDAEYRAVTATTALADVRRALDCSEHLRCAGAATAAGDCKPACGQ